VSRELTVLRTALPLAPARRTPGGPRESAGAAGIQQVVETLLKCIRGRGRDVALPHILGDNVGLLRGPLEKLPASRLAAPRPHAVRGSHMMAWNTCAGGGGGRGEARLREKTRRNALQTVAIESASFTVLYAYKEVHFHYIY